VTWLDSISGVLDSIRPDSTIGSTLYQLPKVTSTLAATSSSSATVGAILVFHSESPFVPLTAPAGLADTLVATSRIVLDPDSIGVPVYRGLILVRFSPTATPYQRWSAISGVGAEVVGGQPLDGTEDVFVLHVSDDSTGAAAEAAVTSLESSSRVQSVSHLLADLGSATYWTPNDGAGLGAADWKLDPDSSFTGSRTWGQGAVGAPFAWSCASGTGVKVAVIDLGMAQNAELSGRVDALSLLRPALSGPALAHGQRVASVLGASANNGSGTAGIAHQAELLLLDIAQYNSNGTPVLKSNGEFIPDNLAFPRAIDIASRTGARVINLSIGIKRSSASNSMKKQWARTTSSIKDLIEQLYAARGLPLPLVVISAANNGSSALAQWGPFAGLRDSMPLTTILVSAASKTKGARLPIATGAGSIDLFAPGHSIAVYDSIAGLDTASGSSFAAPFVSGAAALLLQNKPTLNASELKTILVGSGSQSRAINGVPFLDVYQALRTVSQSSGTPLCGNRLWADTNNVVHAQRTSTTSEALFSAGQDAGSAAMVNVYRGGRRIELHGANTAFALQNSSWQPTTFQGTDTSLFSGAFKGSVLTQDKSDSFISTVSGYWNNSGIHFKIARYSPTWTPIDSVMTSNIPVSLTGSIDPICIREEMRPGNTTYECWQGGQMGTRTYIASWAFGFEPILQNPPTDTIGADGWMHALDPQGRFVVVPVMVRQYSTQYDTTAWTSCEGAPYPSVRCRARTANVVTGSVTRLFRIRLADGAITELNVPALAGGDDVFFLSVNEQGGELAMQVGSVTAHPESGEVLGCSNARYSWISLPSSGATTVQQHVVSMPGPTLCSGPLWGSAGSFLRVRP